MSTFRSDFFHLLVQQAYEDIFYEKNNYYFFLGKIDPWNDENEPESDSFSRSMNYDRRIRDNILYLDRIRPTNASIVAKRYPWKNFDVFDYWDHTQNMEEKVFHCVTSDNSVYKCLYNGGGAKSTVEPSIKSVSPFRTSDGYLWKYMYSIPRVKVNKFLYGPYMPVQKALTDSFYNKGQLEEVYVVSGGSGYQTDRLTYIDVQNTVSGSGAAAEISAVDSNGSITELTLTSSGSNYDYGAQVLIDSELGIGAEIEPEIDGNGSLTGFTIVDGGAGYDLNNDTVQIQVGQASIIPAISWEDGSIVGTYIQNPGAGYSADPILTVEPAVAGTGVYGNSSAVLKAHTYNGKIVNVTIEDPGKDYPIGEETAITVSGDGEGATVIPIIDRATGEILSVSVDNPGHGYTYVEFGISGNGTGAELRAGMDASDITGYQSVIEQTAVEGAIYAVKVTDPGEGYFDDASVTIRGDGQGATGVPVVKDGKIEEIVMTSYGSGYSYAEVIISDSARAKSNTVYSDAYAYAILPPIDGHGFNAVKELFGRTLLIHSVLRKDELLEIVQQDYRQFGILQNPRKSIDNSKVVEGSLLTDFDLEFDTTSGIVLDEVLVNENVRYRVVNFNQNSIRLQQLSFPYSIPSNTFVSENDSSRRYKLNYIVSSPTINKYSGNLLYTTNRAFINPFDDQSFNVRSYLEFKTVQD